MYIHVRVYMYVYIPHPGSSHWCLLSRAVGPFGCHYHHMLEGGSVSEYEYKILKCHALAVTKQVDPLAHLNNRHSLSVSIYIGTCTVGRNVTHA